MINDNYTKALELVEEDELAVARAQVYATLALIDSVDTLTSRVEEITR